MKNVEKLDKIKENILENRLNDLNIYALRELGRRVGVNSPTSKKKDELIKDILSIQNGEKEPVQQKTKQGRPPKTFDYNFTVMDNMSNISLLQYEKDYDSFRCNSDRFCGCFIQFCA